MLKSLLILVALLPATLSAAAPVTESWLMTTDLWGNPIYQSLELEISGERIAGTFDGDPLHGATTAGEIRFSVTDSSGRRFDFAGRRNGDRIVGTAEHPDTQATARRVVHDFVARRIPDRPAGAARTHTFAPKDYSNEFSPHRAPVLMIWPGDSLRTTTIDSGGVDEDGQTRALYGNPQTGPFHVATAEPGDTLVVRIVRLRLNRDYADSLDSIASRALAPSLAAQAGTLGKPVRWALHRERGVATLSEPSDRMRHFEVPLRPMLGGLAVAPGAGWAAISAGDTGRFGGNMDFNEVVEGNTVYLPVQQPGALLYVGDAHALQGDGETSEWALETSMEVELKIDVIKGKSIAMPRVESASQIMVLGQAGSLDDALRAATAGMTQWLAQDYALNLSESAQVLGSSVQYSVVNVAGRSVGIAAKLDKARLAGLVRVD